MAATTFDISTPEKRLATGAFSFARAFASSRCRERFCSNFLERKCVTINLISLSGRLRNLEDTGCGDPAVLPKILQSWGNAPASYFFHEPELWERMQRALDISPEFASVITYRQMAWKIQEMYDARKTTCSAFIDAVTLLGNAFCDHWPADVPCAAGNRRLLLSQRLKGPDRNFKKRLLSLHTQAMSRAVDEMSGGKPINYSRFVHENIAVPYRPEDEAQMRVIDVLDYANTMEAGKTAAIYLYLLVLPYTLI